MKIIEIFEKDMPEKLKKIKNPPKKLYAIGNINLLFEKSFAIIGTRRITQYGQKNCINFATQISIRNIPIVSGLAIGTDTIAHKISLENDNKTIAVLGSGFNHIFPKENITLCEEIVEKGGLILTEYENNEKPSKANFPKRNRIITAISEGILVIEAGYRSGTSITARHAKQQNKPVFALPGRIDNKQGIGVNELLKKGAILTTKIDDILKYFPEFNNEPKKINNKKFNDKYEKIIKILENGEKSIQELLNFTDMEMSELFEIITNMEFEKIITKDYLGRYSLI